jgi:DNA modification methylase
MIKIENLESTDFELIPVDPFWNIGDEPELKMHRIHSYPAKFPAFITSKAIKYTKEISKPVRSIADVFCGCGTTALETKRNNIDFWGCDVNPVATMITKVKSQSYDKSILEGYLKQIISTFKATYKKNQYFDAKERLKYWYSAKQYNNLYYLRQSINDVINKDEEYRLFFLCAFSNILKATSAWLTKSIKPQIDPNKKPSNVLNAFKEQCSLMISANDEIELKSKSKVFISTANFLDEALELPKVDLIVTSPPYVISYEYADLHQLSALWLDFAEDYRDLREGSIGSRHHDYNFNRELKRLNDIGNNIVSRLFNHHKRKAKSVAKYFLDMQAVIRRVFGMLNDEGLALFVIGNTEYKGIRIDNAKHLTESLMNEGFSEVFATKRKISRKILTPYRDKRGKFTTNSTGRKVYSEEFIIIGRK